MADTKDLEHFEREGWLASKQRAWATAPGTPPRGGKPIERDGWFGGARYTLGLLGLVLVAMLAFGGFAVYNEITVHGGEEAGSHGGGGAADEEEGGRDAEADSPGAGS